METDFHVATFFSEGPPHDRVWHSRRSVTISLMHF